jgi:uncharacterized protein YggE
MWKSISLLLLLTLAHSVRSEPELKGSAAELAAYLAALPGRVSLTGEAEVKVPADRALLTLRVVTEHRSLQDASRANQEIRARILRTLAEQGLPNERVKPSRFSSTPRYGMFRDKARSYRVENTVRITALDEKDFQTVAGLVDAIAEVRYESVEFDHAGKEEFKRNALTQALEKVAARKRLYEEALGVRLTPKSFEESAATPLAQELRRLSSIKSDAPSFASGLAQPAEMHVEELPTSFSELVFRGRVVVEYAVEHK